MAVEDDYQALIRKIEAEYQREQAQLGGTIIELQFQLDALWRQRRAGRGYRPHTGPSGPTGPGTGPGTGPSGATGPGGHG